MKDCAPWFHWLVLVVGILYLLADLIGGWAFFGINWWSAALVLAGIGALWGGK